MRVIVLMLTSVCDEIVVLSYVVISKRQPMNLVSRENGDTSYAV